MRERANSLILNGRSGSDVDSLLEELGELAKRFPDLYVNLLEILKRYVGFLNQDVDTYEVSFFSGRVVVLISVLT
jgi:hypothetical protein